MSDRADVVVVGAGPAGSCAAREAARAGARVVVLERKRVVGEPVRCGEFVPRMLLMEIDAPGDWVEQHTEELVLHLPSGEVARLRAPGAVLDRAAFDRALMAEAEEAGARILIGRAVRDVDGHRVVTEQGDVRADAIVGADGPWSRIAPGTGLGRPEHMLARQHVVRLARRVENAHVWFWPTARWGYGWLFPKGDRANLGVAVPWRRADLARRAMEEMTGWLVEDRTLASATPVTRCSGLVPTSGPLPRIASGHVLVAGDAAGHVDALTGAGIASAVRCGALAGRAAAGCGTRGDRAGAASAAELYERECRRLVGSYLARSVEKRDRLRELWDEDVERAVRRAWLPPGR